MKLEADKPNFSASLDRLISPPMAELAVQLSKIGALSAAEREAILAGAEDAMRLTVHGKLSRLLVLELNGMRVKGALVGDTPEARWDYFIHLTTHPSFWEGASRQYPTLLPRISRLIANRCEATRAFASRWAEARDALTPLIGAPAGELTKASFGAGDSHQGGQSVILVSCEGGRVAYKPHTLSSDAALGDFVDRLRQAFGADLPIRTPRVVSYEDHGWAEFVPHTYAIDEDELTRFYVGIGQWLAVMRLLGGTDLHAENLIAHRDTPVIVDCETLFTPKILPYSVKQGEATDRALRFVSGTVLAVGLLPGRGQGLGWRGVDTSGVGALPNQQPLMSIPDIINAGTDEATIGFTSVEAQISQNHPAA